MVHMLRQLFSNKFKILFIGKKGRHMIEISFFKKSLVTLAKILLL